VKKFCPNCDGLLKPTSNPGIGQCVGCGWSGHYWRAAKEPTLPTVAPKMPYVSIDIETTGLDPDTCQILEIGAVWDNWTKPIDELPTYRRLVAHSEYRGNAFALALNAALLKRLSGEREPWFLDPDEVADDFAIWLRSCGWDGQTALTAAGKNFASFDRQFLRRLPRFEQVVKLRHRTLDPAILFWHPNEDEELPGSKTCYERAGINTNVAHTAVEDAQAVVRLVRLGIKRLRENP